MTRIWQFETTEQAQTDPHQRDRAPHQENRRGNREVQDEPEAAPVFEDDDYVFAQSRSSTLRAGHSDWIWLLLALVLTILIAGTQISWGQSQDNYKISPEDVLEIKVFQESDLDTTAKVNADGSIALPLVGSVKVAGRSVDGAIQAIKSAYKNGYLVNPQITIVISEYSERSFTVLGQVASPGSYTFSSGKTMTLLEAIGKAGGYTRIANPGRINIKRSIKGQQSNIRVDAKRNAREGGTVIIMPGDVITVAESIF